MKSVRLGFDRGTDRKKGGDSDESFVQFLINQMTTIDLSNNDDILLNNKYVNKHIIIYNRDLTRTIFNILGWVGRWPSSIHVACGVGGGQVKEKILRVVFTG